MRGCYRLRVLFPLAVLGGLTLGLDRGCCPPTQVCTAEVRAGLAIRVVEAATGEGIVGAVVTATEGDYVETLEGPASSSGAHTGAYERAGTYLLTVEAEGYVSQAVNDVEVVSEPCACHVTPAERTIELTASDAT